MLERLYQLILPQELLDDESDIRVSRFVVLVTSLLTLFLLIAAPIIYWVLGQNQIGSVLFIAAAHYFVSLCHAAHHPFDSLHQHCRCVGQRDRVVVADPALLSRA